MESPAVIRQPTRSESRLALGLFVACLLFHGWGVQVGWSNRDLRGVEFRQAQTALSTYWIHAEKDFSPAYPTPVLGKPWSIPMEFPLYQWTVAVVSQVTHLSITKSGRAVSIACFYLCLPAVFLLLARWRVPVGYRWLVLAVVVTCPFYIFYARAFLIETMALMFALWFWVAFERAVAGRSRAWLAVAAIAGIGAGLVKVTTFLLYLLPAGIWALHRLATAPGRARGAELRWMAATTAGPGLVAVGWVIYADAVKAQNPLAAFLLSGNLREFNFGTWAMRLSPEVWTMQARIMREEITWLPAVALAGLAWLAGKGANLRGILTCLAAFVAVLVIFPLLYALHDYYFAANAMLLMMAMGLAVTGWLGRGHWRGLAWVFALAIPLGQGWGYLQRYYPYQQQAGVEGDGLTAALRALTQPDEVIVVLGQDWNSMTPYYARRKALMFRDDMARDPAQVEAALQRLDGEKLGALIIVGDPDGRQWLIDRTVARGLHPQALMAWRDARVHVPTDRQTTLMHRLLDEHFHEVSLAPEIQVPRDHLAGQWVPVAPLRPWERRPFHAMEPQPLRFFSSFGPALDEAGGRTRFGAHPVTRLIFALPAGQRTLRTTLEMGYDAYRPELSDAEASDGVEVALYALGPNGERHLLESRLFDPRHRPEHRGEARPWVMDFVLHHPGEVELFFGPGPRDSDTRDWIMVGPLRFE